MSSFFHALFSFGQANSQNGYWFTPRDTVRAFLVFAEMTNDPDYNTWSAQWQPDQLPNNADKFFQSEINQQLTAIITQYFHEMSFGNFVLLGDYYPQIMQVD